MNIKKRELWEYKLDILYRGISISKKCFDTLKKGINNQINNDDYITTKGLMIVLDNKIYVNADINEESYFQIDYEDEQYILKYNNKLICNIRIIQPPEFALMRKKLSSGELLTNLINIHGDRVRIQPIEGCAFRCAFCSLNKFNYKKYSIDILDEAFQYALNNCSFEHVLISGGTPKLNQEDYTYLNNVYQFFGKKYGDKIPIDIMLAPRGLEINDNSIEQYEIFLNKLKEWNISGLSINLELFNDEMRKKYIPNKDNIGKLNYLKFIELAVKIFGKGNVRSCIIIGLEEISDSLKAVEELSKIGCMPVLSPYIPINNTINKPRPELTKEVLLQAKKITDNYSIELGPKCNSCKHNTINF